MITTTEIATSDTDANEAKAVEDARKEFSLTTEREALRLRKDTEASPALIPSTIGLHKINTTALLFRTRNAKDMNERHISEMVRSIRASGNGLDPLLVIWIGKDPYLIDGYHRFAAYRRAGWKKPVRIKTFFGTVDEAVLISGQCNGKAKLGMTTRERQCQGWKLVLLGDFSKLQIARSAGISTSQVATMRNVARTLGAEAFGHSEWLSARNAAQGISWTMMTDEERTDRLEAQADDWADRLLKTFGNRLATNPELAAMALERYFGRKLGQVVRELRAAVDSQEDDQEDYDF